MTMKQCLSCEWLELCTYPDYDDGAAGARCMYHPDADDFVKSFTTEHECDAWEDRDKPDILVWKMSDHERLEVVRKVGTGIIEIIKATYPAIGVRVILYDVDNTGKAEMRRALFDGFDEWWDGK